MDSTSQVASSEETGSLGIRHIKRLWSRTLANRTNPNREGLSSDDWVKDNTLVCGLRLGLHEIHQYLNQSTSLDQFERWILEMNGGTIDQNRIERLNAALSGSLKPEPPDPKDAVFTDTELSFWEENGYIVLHNAVSPEGCTAALNAICTFLNVDLNNPESWYGGPQGHSIWIPLLHHPALEANRNSQRIFHAFAQLWKRTDLWVTTDQAGLNPPERPGWKFPGPHLHWDMSLALPITFGVQGILYLADTAADQGAFTCVPGFHRKIESWLKNLPPGCDPRRENLEALGPIPIAGRAGDLVIWHHALPHGSSPNRAKLPRVAQYIKMYPSQWEYNTTWR